MKKLIAVSALAMLVCFAASAALAEITASPQEQTALAEKTFTGKILSARQKGSIANPYIVIECAGEDAQKVSFNIKGKTVITDVDGKTLRTMSGPKKGHTVEIKYSVVKEQNEASSIRYLD